MKSPVHVVRPDIGNGHDLDVFRIQGSDQHVSFVTGSNDTDPYGICNFPVVKIHGA